GKVQAIVSAASCVVVLACVLVGPEKHSVEFDGERPLYPDFRAMRSQSKQWLDGPSGGSADTGSEKEQSAWTPVEKAEDSGPSSDSTVA
ncbi:hypothetical protein V5O48_011717, partial [Marasmius crinis-equi]